MSLNNYERRWRVRVSPHEQRKTLQDKNSDAEDLYLKGRDEQFALAKTIVETATELERDLTAGEAAAVQKHLDEADKIEQKVAAHEKSQKILAQLDAMAVREQSFKDGEPTSSLTAVADDRRLCFKGMAAAVATKMLGDNAFGTKALAPSGASVVSQEFQPDPVALGRPVTTLLDVLPVRQHTTPEYSFLRQSVRTNLAAVVADNAVKPTSVYSVVRVEQTLSVIAQLSEPIPRFWLSDSTALQQFIQNELQYGLALAVEAKVLADVNGTSGVQTCTFTTLPLATLRTAISKIGVVGHVPAALLVHPTDWLAVELALSSSNAVDYQGLPYDASARRLFSVPIVVSNAQTVGVGHALAAGAVILDTDTQGVGIQWSENATADSFARNQAVCRVEGRYGTSCPLPLGVIVADLSA
jgi:HK97 family phage major capsid protein